MLFELIKPKIRTIKMKSIFLFVVVSYFFFFIPSLSTLAIQKNHTDNPSGFPAQTKHTMVPVGIINLFPKQTTEQRPLVTSGYTNWQFFENKLVGELDNEWLACYEVSENMSYSKLLWTFPNQKGGLSVPPFAKDNHVVLAFKTGEISKVDINTGEKKWSTNVIGSYIEKPLTLYNSQLFIITFNQTLYNLSYDTGSINWAYQLGTKNDVKIRTMTKPIFSHNNIYLGNSEGDVISINIESGTLDWKSTPNFETQGRFKDNVGEALLFNNTLYMSRYDGNIFALDLSTEKKEVIWHFQTKKNITSSTYSNGIFFVGTTGGSLYALELDSGKNHWKQAISLGNSTITSISAGEKSIYLTGSKGKIFLIKRETGEVEWSDDLKTQLLSPPIYVKNHLFFPSGKKELYAYHLFK